VDKKLLKKIAEVANSVDEKGLAKEADELDTVMQELGKEVEPEKPEVKPEEETKSIEQTAAAEEKPEAKEEGESNLSNKQKNALRGFAKAAERVLDTLTLSTRTFPDDDDYAAASNLITAIRSLRKFLNKFKDEIPGIATAKLDIQELVKIANDLDEKGLTKEADELDLVLNQYMNTDSKEVDKQKRQLAREKLLERKEDVKDSVSA
jgi:hypothetical protein